MRKKTFYEKCLKRLLDFFLSFIALVVLSPILLIIYILSLICLGGNPIFKQYRPGKNGKIFPLYKFRSMTNKKDKEGNLLPDAQRITTWGKILRKTSIDELPQLINILVGHMSIVGPRPRLVKDMIFYPEEVMRAYTVRPGLTSPSQVSGGRSESSWDTIFEEDLKYSEKITFWGDVKVILKTVVAVFKSDSSSGGAATSKREYYFGDYLVKSQQITNEQYELGLAMAGDIIASKKGNVTYQEKLKFNPDNKIEYDVEPVLEVAEIDKSLACSVIIPMYNAERFIENTLNSVINQTVKNIEIIVVNDCSKDNGVEVVKKMQKKDKRIVLLENEKNMRVSETRNNGIRHAHGEYVALLDADDMWEPEFLEKVLARKDETGGELVASSESFMSDDGERLSGTFIVRDEITYKRLLKQNSISCSAVLVKRQLLLENPFRADDVHEDYLCWLTILKKIGKGYGVKDVVSVRRLTVGSKSRNKIKALKMSYKTYKKHKVGLIRRLYYTFCNALNGLKKYSKVNKVKSNKEEGKEHK